MGTVSVYVGFYASSSCGSVDSRRRCSFDGQQLADRVYWDSFNIGRFVVARRVQERLFRSSDGLVLHVNRLWRDGGERISVSELVQVSPADLLPGGQFDVFRASVEAVTLGGSCPAVAV